MTFGNGGDEAFVHREILQTAALVVVAIAAFVFTRAIAASSRTTTLKDAEAWYQRGREQVAHGQLESAIASFRRATVRNRVERRYVLALAHALALQHETEPARSALLALRESFPEDPEINLELARLAAQRQDVTEAVRFYHNALYAPWPSEAADARRAARLELIEFLLNHAQSGRALSELLAVANDLPDQLRLYDKVGQLFTRAGDYRHALDQFQHALAVDPADPTALAGAGISAFHLGDFARARTFLRKAPTDRSDVVHAREVADLILSKDPLVNRIGNAERRRRLIADIDYVEDRLARCLAGRTANPPEDGTPRGGSATAALREQLRLYPDARSGHH